VWSHTSLLQGTSTYRDSFIPKEAPYKLVKPVNAFEPNK
jgi:hypothetical protein